MDCLSTYATKAGEAPSVEMRKAVFTRDEQSGAFADSGIELAVFLPEQELEGTAGEQGDGRPQLPPTM
jgi:hypothetical protein